MTQLLWLEAFPVSMRTALVSTLASFRRKPESGKVLAAFCLNILIAGCTLMPAYERPAAPVPERYDAQMTPDAQEKSEKREAGESSDIHWRDYIQDKNMQRLISLALDNNRDLRVATLNIERARAQYQIQEADLSPTINGGADASLRRQSGGGTTGISRQYTASLGFSAYELDLFGRVQSQGFQAVEFWRASDSDAQSARLSLIAEVAALYLQLVTEREILDLTRSTLQNRQSRHQLIETRRRSGLASELDDNQALSLVEEAQASLARYETLTGQTGNLLALLIGAPLPADLPDVRKLSDVTGLADIPAGLPSELLERRPDIRAAEHRLKSANASIGVARANFFPSIRLTGALGALSADAGQLFSGGNGFWQFMPQINVPLFDQGRNQAQLAVSETDWQIAVARYEQSIQNAFREVTDALILRQHIVQQMAAEARLVDTHTRNCRLAAIRYDAGIDGYFNVLDAQRNLYTAQQSYLATRLQRESNALALFKALGGDVVTRR